MHTPDDLYFSLNEIKRLVNELPDCEKKTLILSGIELVRRDLQAIEVDKAHVSSRSRHSLKDLIDIINSLIKIIDWF